jgi:hypothetical protein
MPVYRHGRRELERVLRDWPRGSGADVDVTAAGVLVLALAVASRCLAARLAGLLATFAGSLFATLARTALGALR